MVVCEIVRLCMLGCMCVMLVLGLMLRIWLNFVIISRMFFLSGIVLFDNLVFVLCVMIGMLCVVVMCNIVCIWLIVLGSMIVSGIVWYVVSLLYLNGLSVLCLCSMLRLGVVVCSVVMRVVWLMVVSGLLICLL